MVNQNEFYIFFKEDIIMKEFFDFKGGTISIIANITAGTIWLYIWYVILDLINFNFAYIPITVLFAIVFIISLLLWKKIIITITDIIASIIWLCAWSAIFDLADTNFDSIPATVLFIIVFVTSLLLWKKIINVLVINVRNRWFK